MEMKSKTFRFYLVLLFIFFLYFLFAVYNRTYSGITVDKYDNEWIVRQVHNLGSFANHQEIIGSSIIQIDGQSPDSNFLLSRFLIVDSTVISLIHKRQKQRKNWKTIFLFYYLYQSDVIIDYSIKYRRCIWSQSINFILDFISIIHGYFHQSVSPEDKRFNHF